MKECCKKALENKLDKCPECGLNLKLIQMRIDKLKELGDKKNA